MISVRIASRSDTERLIEFIGEHWANRHIFVEAPEVFEWQHQQPDGRLNMMLAEDTSSDPARVLGVLGFIPTGRFSPELGDDDLTLAIWKVREDGVPPGVGLQLLKRLQAELSPRLVAAIGTSEMVRPIYRALKYEVGELHHAALFASEPRSEYRIADGVPSEAHRPIRPTRQLQLPRLIDRDDAAEVCDQLGVQQVPQKGWEYVSNRYVRHPWYNYDVRLVVVDAVPTAIVVWRRVTTDDAAALRIVDVIGSCDWLDGAASVLRRALDDTDAEYIDIMSIGIDAELLTQAGFITSDDYEHLVLPNYFSPFERRNIRIEAAWRRFDHGNAPTRLFRADADQDRPNRRSDLQDQDGCT